MVLQYLLLSIPFFQGIKVYTHYGRYNTTLVVFIGRNVQKIAEKIKQNWFYLPKYLLTASTRLFTCNFS
jgi:hypothetical protein